MQSRLSAAACIAGIMLAVTSVRAAPAVVRDGEFEKMVLGTGNEPAAWSPDESRIDVSGDHAAAPGGS
jgi:hypothetical protein